MTSIILSSGQPFSLRQTLSCGQVFRWDMTEDGWWYGVVGNNAIKIRQDGNRLRFFGADTGFIEHYFALDVDLPSITASFDRDPFIHAAVTKCAGLRIIRQPAWECLISYTIATNSNIPTIRKRIAALAERFGKPVKAFKRTFYTFPGPGDISCGDETMLECCKLGYRQPFVYRTACEMQNPEAWMEQLRSLSYEDAHKEMMIRSGIGPKAADCILLFAFEKYEAFPVDVWIRRIMHEHYLPELTITSTLSRRDYDAVRRYAKKYFGKYCGYAQEYLFAAREG